MKEYCVRNIIIGEEEEVKKAISYLNVLKECLKKIDENAALEYIEEELWAVKNISSLYKALEIVDFFNLSFDFIYSKDNVYINNKGAYNKVDLEAEISEELKNENITTKQAKELTEWLYE